MYIDKAINDDFKLMSESFKFFDVFPVVCETIFLLE